MKLVIIPIDSAVYVDGSSYSNIDLSSCNIPENIHALQWNGVKGWLEFLEDENFNKPDNQLITELPEWANKCKVKWDELKQIEESFLLKNDGVQPITSGTQEL